MELKMPLTSRGTKSKWTTIDVHQILETEDDLDLDISEICSSSSKENIKEIKIEEPNKNFVWTNINENFEVHVPNFNFETAGFTDHFL